MDRWHVQSMEGPVIVFGHMSGHVTLKVQRDHVMDHVIASQGHVPLGSGHCMQIRLFLPEKV